MVHGAYCMLGMKASDVHMKANLSSTLELIPRPESLSKIVTEKLRYAILSSQLQPGEIYSEKELALQFGVSRTPVREAMRVLLAEKIVVPVAGRGIKVNHFSARDLEEVFELRKTLEVAVVEKIASHIHIKKNGLDIPRKYLEEQRRAFTECNYPRIIHLNRLFHTSLCLIGGNSRMESILNQTLDIIQITAKEFVLVPDRNQVSVSDRGKMVMQEHQNILDSLLNGEATQARQVMIQHLDRSLAAVLKVYRSQKRIEEILD
jgi:GntR family transcriptional regulator, rspAB operon transcriptional repressor